MDQHPAISVRDLRRRYGPPGPGGHEAVQGVSFAVRRGELFALLGTNGAGKTSALEVLEGLALPTAGTVRVLGLDPYRERRALRHRTGTLLQDGGLPGDLTVGETVRLWAGTMAAPRPAAEALALADLADRARVAVRQLSGGERRRLHLALAVLGHPQVVFLDEPTSGLDPESRVRTRHLVRGLVDAGATVLLCTHDLHEAESLADRLGILHRGRLVRTGTPSEVTAAHPARLAFTVCPDSREDVPDLPGALGADVTEVGGSRRVVVRTHDLQRSLTALLGWAAARGEPLDDLQASPSSLEEAFLAVAAGPQTGQVAS